MAAETERTPTPTRAPTRAPARAPALESFPNEILLQILHFLPPEDNLAAFQLLSRHLHRVANTPHLWRHHCRASFKYWNSDHEFQQKLRAPVADVDWKRLFIERRQRNERIAVLFDGILSSRLGRLWRFEQICHSGYDAKDFLVEQCRVDEDAEDVLARRYFANAVLDSIHKEVAIRQWASFTRDVVPVLRRSPGELSSRDLNRVIERNQAAFDMFILHDQPGDMDEISAMLDNIAADFLDIHDGIDAMSTREKALTLNRWLRSRNLLGMDRPETNYRQLRNCFMGQALRHEPHDSLPLISSVIYSSVAGRIGLDAQPCLFPSHVLALVAHPPGETLDGEPLTQVDTSAGDPSGTTPEDAMYLDPYGNDGEVPLSTLQTTLSSYGWHANTDAFLSRASPANIAMRTAHNIRAAFRSDLSAPHSPEPYAPASSTSLPVSGASAPSRDAAVQAYLWARLMLIPPSDMEWVQTLHRLTDRFVNSWLGDVWLVERFLAPLYDAAGPDRQAWDDPRNMVLTKRQLDAAQPLAKGRAGRRTDVRFRVGQVVRHRRLDFVAVVAGWTDDGSRLGNDDIVEQLVEYAGADAPKIFYNCLRAGSLTQVQVMQESIAPLEDGGHIPHELFEIAGLYFKRFDVDTGMFVSNIREEYPDD